MSSRTPAADEFAAINEALKQIEREKAAEMPKAFPDYTPVETVYGDATEVWGHYMAPGSDCALRAVYSPYQLGWKAGLESIDCRLCPFERRTTAWCEWHSAHAKATSYLTEFNKASARQPTEFDKAGFNA